MKHPQGFSLIETVLALGIIATLLMAALSLLPAALDTTRSAEQRNAEAMILANVRARCASALPTDELYFTRSGSALSSKTENTATIVTVRQGDSLALPGDTERSVRIALVNMRASNGSWQRIQTLSLAP